MNLCVDCEITISSRYSALISTKGIRQYNLSPMGFEWIASKNYKRHFICLKCQKGFKRPSEEDMKHSESANFSSLMNDYYTSGVHQDIVKYIKAAHEKVTVICPNCQNKMLQVQYDFEVPPQRDTKSWKSIRKSMQSKTVIDYDTYVHWHLLELGKVVAASSEFEKLNQNLEKLKTVSTN